MKTVLVFILYILGCEPREFLLTTASLHDDFFKPTTKYRRFYGNERPSTPINLFEEKKRGREKKRSHSSDVWNWDSWCLLQPHKGNCTKKKDRFYYDTRLDKCEKFKYTGCGGNHNRFDNEVECMRHCKGRNWDELLPAGHLSGAAFMDTNTNLTASCSMQPSPGKCLALYLKYYYDVNEGDCKRFIYGGCGGNDNRFNTKYKCRKKCTKVDGD